MDPRASRSRTGDEGFTILEILIALTVLIIGIVAVTQITIVAMSSSIFSRHATEATVLAEDKLEELRTEPTATLTSSSDVVNALGLPDDAGIFTRTWTVTPGASTTAVAVVVSWSDDDEGHSITLRTERAQ